MKGVQETKNIQNEGSGFMVELRLTEDEARKVLEVVLQREIELKRKCDLAFDPPIPWDKKNQKDYDEVKKIREKIDLARAKTYSEGMKKNE